MVKKLNLAVLISGGGSNLQALIDACKNPQFPAKIAVVISNVPEAYGLQRAQKENIPAIVINHKNYTTREDFDEDLHLQLEKHNAEIVCLAGFMRILTSSFVKKWEGRMLNTHPALLPKHGGRGMYGEHVHKAVLAAGDTESGVSIHYVIPEVDRGEIILQKRVPVLSGDTAETLAVRVLAEEHKAYVDALRMVAGKLLART